jgi:hypothetical protein
MNNQEPPSMIYVGKDVDVNALRESYENCLAELSEFFDDCIQSYDDRRNIWIGKTDDLRKQAANAFPWQGSSDMEVNVIGERIDAFVAILDQALQKSHIKAFPTSMASMGKAAVVSSFLKWMKSSYIPNFREEMELGSNYLLEKGLMVTYVGWKKEKRTYKQLVTIDQIAEAMPEVAEMILGGGTMDDLIDIMQQAFPEISKKRAKESIKSLQKTGQAEVPVPRNSVDCPVVHSCAPDGEVLFPPSVSDPQRAPYVFWRTFLSPQEIEKKVVNEGWDAEWAENAINSLRGKDTFLYDGERQKSTQRTLVTDDNNLVMVIYAYQRLIDEEDGSEGIYCTVFHPDAPYYAKHELLNGYDDYPFVVTRLSADQKQLYETTNFSKILRGAQMQIKTERDSRIDRASLATSPPLMHPAGRPPSDWGPSRLIPYRRLGEITFGPIPPADSGSERIEAQMVQQADRAVGLDPQSPMSIYRQQFVVDKFLSHVRDVLGLAWTLFQRMGPDEVFFQVTGNPNPQTMTKGDPDDKFSIVVSFDSQTNDPEVAETQLKNMVSLVQLDRNGRMDVDKLLEFAASAINPIFADYVLQPAEEAQDKITKDITDDLTKIYSGIEVAARPNGAQTAMQIVQAYVQQPDIAQKAQQDPAFAERLQKYAGQYQFMMQQAENAQIGQIGTAPAQMGGVDTQAMQK